MLNWRFKRCGLFLACFIMLGLSLSVSLDTNALRHNVSYIPIATKYSWSPGFSGSLPGNPGFIITWKSEYIDSSSYKRGTAHYFGSHFVENSGNCEFGKVRAGVGYDQVAYPSLVSDYGYTTFTYRLPSYRFFYGSATSYSDYYSVAQCMQTVPFGVLNTIGNIDSHPPFDDSSLVNIPLLERPNYINLSPYYYDYDSIYFNNSVLDTNSGITYTNSLTSSQILGAPISKFQSMTIPLGSVNSSITGSFYEGREIEYKGVFDFSGENTSFSWGPDSSSSYFRLYYSGRNYEQSTTNILTNTYGYVDCDSVYVNVELENYHQLQFSCKVTSPIDVYDDQLYFWLQIYNPDYVWETNVDWSFGSSYFVTDNDDSPGGTWGHEPTGSHLELAPGNASQLLPGQQDWFYSLAHMFDISTFNPFSSIFGLFSNSSSCAQIPTIAGMIHSNEIQVCPFFDSTTRQIATPVVGISSLMVLFGFLVRWLGARSCNFIEDSGGIDVGGYHFENKFRRGRKN